MANFKENIKNKDKLGILFICVIGLIYRILLVFQVLPDNLYDDAYIILRFARNLINGLGFVYNAGERVWGSTSPVFTLLLATIGKIVGVLHLEAAAVWTGIAGSIVFLVLLGYIFKFTKLNKGLLIISLLSISLLPAFTGNSVSGMETPLVLMLMGLSLLFYIKRRWYILGVICGILILTRIDTLIWIGVLLCHALMERRLHSIRVFSIAIAIFFTTIIIWFLPAFFYFGTIIPQSLIGKAVGHEAFQLLTLKYIEAFLSIYFPLNITLNPVKWVVVAILFVVLVLGGKHLWVEYSDLRPVISFFVVYNLMFVLAHSPLFLWYFTPVEWIFYLLLWSGVEKIFKYIYSSLHYTTLVGRIFYSMIKPVVWCSIGCIIIFYSIFHMKVYDTKNAFHFDVWVEVSDFISTYTTGETKVFLEHIGLVGYRTNRYIYDSIGLVMSDITDIRREYGTNWLEHALKHCNPDVIILYLWETPDKTDIVSLSDSGMKWVNQEYYFVTNLSIKKPLVNVYFLKNSPYIRHLIFKPQPSNI